jgi:hypothetical protein
MKLENYVLNCINSNMTLILAEVGLDHDNMRPHGIARQAKDISDLKRSSPIAMKPLKVIQIA